MLDKLQSVNEKNRLQFPKEFARILSPYFTKEQCDIMLGIETSNTHKWSDRYIANALTLKCINPKAYRYIRDTWKTPLPAISTLNKHVCKINYEPGILNSFCVNSHASMILNILYYLLVYSLILFYYRIER